MNSKLRGFTQSRTRFNVHIFFHFGYFELAFFSTQIHWSMMISASVDLQFRRWEMTQLQWTEVPVQSLWLNLFSWKAFLMENFYILYFRFPAQCINLALKSCPSLSWFYAKRRSFGKKCINFQFVLSVCFIQNFQLKQFSLDPSQEPCLLCWYISPMAGDHESCYLKQYTC